MSNVVALFVRWPSKIENHVPFTTLQARTSPEVRSSINTSSRVSHPSPSRSDQWRNNSRLYPAPASALRGSEFKTLKGSTLVAPDAAGTPIATTRKAPIAVATIDCQRLEVLLTKFNPPRTLYVYRCVVHPWLGNQGRLSLLRECGFPQSEQ